MPCRDSNTAQKFSVQSSHASSPADRSRRRRSGMLVLIFSCLLIGSAGKLWAGTTGVISGTLKDSTGALIAGATVQVTNIAQGTQAKLTSDANGAFIFPSLPVGHYD